MVCLLSNIQFLLIQVRKSSHCSTYWKNNWLAYVPARNYILQPTVGMPAISSHALGHAILNKSNYDPDLNMYTIWMNIRL